MLSRVAENIYWMSRYMERTNISLRALNACYIAYQDGFPVMNWNQIGKQFGVNNSEGLSSYEIMYKIIFDANAEFSFLNNVFKARENARSAQDHITKELWQTLNNLYHLIKGEHLVNELKVDPINIFDQLIKQMMHYYGIIDNSMERGEAFIFLHFGKLEERGLQIIELLRTQLKLSSMHNGEEEDLSWRYLLMALNGYDNYISEHVGVLIPKEVLYQILYKSNFPNSLYYTWRQIEHYNSMLASDGLKSKELTFVIGKSYSFIKYNLMNDAFHEQMFFLEEAQQNYYHFSNTLNKVYFKLN